ncbi:MAG: Oxidoreductase, partial [uncultured Sphingomonas sp.]
EQHRTRSISPARPLGPARVPARARHHDLRLRLGLGRRRRRGPPHLRPVRRPGRQLHRDLRQLHQRRVRADGRRVRQREAPTPRARDQVHDGARSGDPNSGGNHRL